MDKETKGWALIIGATTLAAGFVTIPLHALGGWETVFSFFGVSAIAIVLIIMLFRGISFLNEEDEEEKMTTNPTIKFTEESVKNYLDDCIKFWRKDKRKISKYYIDAYQSMRISLFGKLLLKK